MRINNARTKIVGMIRIAVFLSVSVAAAYAVAGPGSQESWKGRIPQTAEEHRVMAQSYRAKAVSYERESEDHRRMCEEYDFKVSMPETLMKAGPSLMQAQKNCERYRRDTASLVEDARELAEYHTARAKALEVH